MIYDANFCPINRKEHKYIQLCPDATRRDIDYNVIRVIILIIAGLRAMP